MRAAHRHEEILRAHAHMAEELEAEAQQTDELERKVEALQAELASCIPASTVPTIRAALLLACDLQDDTVDFDAFSLKWGVRSDAEALARLRAAVALLPEPCDAEAEQTELERLQAELAGGRSGERSADGAGGAGVHARLWSRATALSPRLSHCPGRGRPGAPAAVRAGDRRLRGAAMNSYTITETEHGAIVQGPVPFEVLGMFKRRYPKGVFAIDLQSWFGSTFVIAESAAAHEAWKAEIAVELARITDPHERWLRGFDTGLSSRTIFHAFTGRGLHDRQGSVPHDHHDLGRCVRLLTLFPEFTPLSRVSEAFPAWDPVLARWDELVGLYTAGDMDAVDILLRQVTQ